MPIEQKGPLMTMTVAPHIGQVLPNSLGFRSALDAAGKILAGGPLGVYSRHCHYDVFPDEVVFEEEVAPGGLKLHPLPQQTAASMGLPSCWGVTSDGTLVVLRYADWGLHERATVDVESAEFLGLLARAAQGIARASLHTTLELNVATSLFPPGDNHVTYEVTKPGERWQTVTRIPTPQAVTDGDWSEAACWSFTSTGEPFVTGMCNDLTVQAHGGKI